MNHDTSIEVFANNCFANTNKGFSDLMAWTIKIMSKEIGVMFVMEATAIYHEAFAYYLFDKDKPISIALSNKISSYARVSDAAVAIQRKLLELTYVIWKSKSATALTS